MILGMPITFLTDELDALIDALIGRDETYEVDSGPPLGRAHTKIKQERMRIFREAEAATSCDSDPSNVSE